MQLAKAGFGILVNFLGIAELDGCRIRIEKLLQVSTAPFTMVCSLFCLSSGWGSSHGECHGSANLALTS